MMKKSIIVVMLVVLSIFGLVAAVQAANELKGTMYVSGHGGHLAIVDLATLKEPIDIEKDRIVITEAAPRWKAKLPAWTLKP
jgi:hypothetical protein